MHYNFYFDESYHDRAITLSSEGTLNVLDESKNDSYIGVFWGCKNTDSSKNLKILSQFEKRQRINFGLLKEKELKSTIISKKQFTNGVKSFNNNTLEFYADLFKTLHKLNPIIQIEAISKVEFYLRRIFNRTQLPPQVNDNAFFYSLTKFFVVYHNSQLLQKLYAPTEAECEAKLAELIKEMNQEIATEKANLKVGLKDKTKA